MRSKKIPFCFFKAWTAAFTLWVKRKITHAHAHAHTQTLMYPTALSCWQLREPHLIVNILGVQAVLFVSISLHVLPVLGADDHDDEDRFLWSDSTPSAVCRRRSVTQFGFRLGGSTYVIQKAVHPFVDAHPSDRIVKDVDLSAGQARSLWVFVRKVTERHKRWWRHDLLLGWTPDQSEIWWKEGFLRPCPLNTWWKHSLTKKKSVILFTNPIPLPKTKRTGACRDTDATHCTPQTGWLPSGSPSWPAPDRPAGSGTRPPRASLLEEGLRAQ